MIGRTVSHFKVVEKIGDGGMGVVYRAEDVLLKRDVALKFLPPEISGDDEARQRFLREARAASALDHPRIAPVLDISETEAGRPFIVMPFYDGETLKEAISRGPLPIDDAVEYALQIAEGLASAHDAGIVHRDIKPANIQLCPPNDIKILDFGVAKLDEGLDLTKTGATLGTAYYMSPEQIAGAPVDGRSDLWSLGVVLYEMLAGVRPFEGDYEHAVLYAVTQSEPRPVQDLRPEVPDALAGVVARLLRKDPEKRCSSATVLVQELRSLKTADPADQSRTAYTLDGRTSRLLVGIIAALALVGAGYLIMSQPAESPRIDELAVLPLSNISGDPEEQFFADGMTDALIARMAQIEDIHVISRQSVMRFKNSERPLQEIARRLDVDAVVEGTVLSSGGKVRVTAQLIDAQTDAHLWARTYERPLENVLELQRDLALAVAGEIDVQLAPEDRDRFASATRVDSAAYKLYLKGRQRRQRRTEEGATAAIEYLKRSLARDSSFAPAFAELSLAYDYFNDWRRSRDALDRALELNPDLPAALYAKGRYHQFEEWDLERSARAYRRALELDPGQSEIHTELGWTLYRQGRRIEGDRHMERALELDPLSPYAHHSVAAAHYYRGDYDGARKHIENCLRLDPSYWLCHADAYRLAIQTGDYSRAMEAMDVVASMAPQNSGISADLMALRARLLKVNTTEGRRALFDQAGELSEQEGHSPVQVAELHLSAGRKEAALAWLERAASLHDQLLLLYDLRVSPEFARLHGDPRFESLLQQAGL